MEQAELQLELRTISGKKVRQLRAIGVVPVHVYGPGITSISAQVSKTDLSQVLSAVGKTTPLRLLFSESIEESNSILVFIRETQRHPTTGALQHVDFLKVDAGQRMTGSVPIVLSGDAPAVRVLGGVLSQSLYFVSVECLPLDMPQSFSADVSVLEGFGDSVTVADLPLPLGVSMLSESASLVARVTQSRHGGVAEEAQEEQAGAPKI
jgi:large subunit ribosomal protein L25